jgi:hypothetical protein
MPPKISQIRRYLAVASLAAGTIAMVACTASQEDSGSLIAEDEASAAMHESTEFAALATVLDSLGCTAEGASDYVSDPVPTLIVEANCENSLEGARVVFIANEELTVRALGAIWFSSADEGASLGLRAVGDQVEELDAEELFEWLSEAAPESTYALLQVNDGPRPSAPAVDISAYDGDDCNTCMGEEATKHVSVNGNCVHDEELVNSMGKIAKLHCWWRSQTIKLTYQHKIFYSRCVAEGSCSGGGTCSWFQGDQTCCTSAGGVYESGTCTGTTSTYLSCDKVFEESDHSFRACCPEGGCDF